MATLDTDVNMVPAGEGSSGAGPSNTAPQPPQSSKKSKKFEIKKWNAVSLWAWGNRYTSSPLFRCVQICFESVRVGFVSIFSCNWDR